MGDSAGNNFKAGITNIFLYLIENMVITIWKMYNLSRDKNLKKAKSRIESTKTKNVQWMDLKLHYILHKKWSVKVTIYQ